MSIKGSANAAIAEVSAGPLATWIRKITVGTAGAVAAPVAPIFSAQVSLTAGTVTLLLPQAIDPLTAIGSANYQVEGPAPLGVLRVSFPDPTHVMVTSLDPVTLLPIPTDTSRIMVIVQA